MATVQIDLVSPSGVPCVLTVTKDDDQADIIATLERADKIGAYFAGKGWSFAATPAAGPSAHELDQGPTFCGYRCSPTVDSRGLPTWIIANNQQCLRHEKQGDVWWSYRLTDGSYEQVLRIPKGEKIPQVRGL